MYWSTWSFDPWTKGIIETAWMDGSHNKVFVDSNLHWPTGLTVDYTNRQLYWCDAALDKIESINLDGTNRQLIAGKPIVHRPYSLAYANNLLYWSMNFKQENYAKINVLRLGGQPPLSSETLVTNSPYLVTLKVANKKAQEGGDKYVCSYDLSGCTELCLMTPRSTTCACTDGYTFLNGECHRDSSYRNPSRCSDDHFQCAKNHRCVSHKYLCDGYDDCEDGSDEMIFGEADCRNITCAFDHFLCDSTRCISKHWVCDGVFDCIDRSDEETCKSFLNFKSNIL